MVSSVRNGENFVAEIPNSLLQQPYPIIIYVYSYSDTNSARTIYTIKIPVTPRVKPSDYIDSSAVYHYTKVSNSNFSPNPIMHKKIITVEDEVGVS